ncbi:MAG: class I SAM-dependent methyltransferase [Motiliproteus sp.]
MNTRPTDPPITLTQQLLDALCTDGKDPERLTTADLDAVDQFHIRGKLATVELADILFGSLSERHTDVDVDAEAGRERPSATVTQTPLLLDLGSGLGGSARYLAARSGWGIRGLELSTDYVDAARELTARVELAAQVQFRIGDATDIPHPDQCFDAVWLQHVSMCIADKTRLCDEIFRVLKPGGCLALQEIIAGPEKEALFPVPWAMEACDSYLSEQNELTEQLQQAGLVIEHSQDLTGAALQWFERQAARRPENRPASALSLKLLLGGSYAAMMTNQLRNLREQRIGLLQVIARRPVKS